MIRFGEVRENGFGKTAVCGVAELDRLLSELVVLESAHTILDDGVGEKMLDSER